MSAEADVWLPYDAVNIGASTDWGAGLGAGLEHELESLQPLVVL